MTSLSLVRVGNCVLHCTVLMRANSPKHLCKFMDVCSCVSGHSSAVDVGMVAVLVLQSTPGLYCTYNMLCSTVFAECLLWLSLHTRLTSELYSLTFAMVTVTPEWCGPPAYSTNGGQCSGVSYESNDSHDNHLQNAVSIL